MGFLSNPSILVVASLHSITFRVIEVITRFGEHRAALSLENAVKNFYLIAAIAGAVVPYIFFVDFFTSEGINLAGFVSALFVNGAAGGFAADLLITSAVFWAYLVAARVPRVWLYVLANLTIGLSFALPLYLYFATPSAEQS